VASVVKVEEVRSFLSWKWFGSSLSETAAGASQRRVTPAACLQKYPQRYA
jgi:hypothetical protein